MKKIITLLLAITTCVSFSACGKQKAFDLSKQSFADIHSAYEKTESMSADVYEAWRIGVNHGTEYLGTKHDDLSFLTNDLSLTDDDIYRGLAHSKFLYDEFVLYTGTNSYRSVDDIEDYVEFLKDRKLQ